MKHRLLSLLAAICMAVSGFSAVQYTLNESFESGIPEDWSQEVVNTAAGGAWILDDLATNPAGAYDGDHRVALRDLDGSFGYCVRLVTPSLDLSQMVAPVLSFAYAQPRQSTFCDTLAIYYRISDHDPWVMVRKYDTYQGAWSLQTIELPAACRTATCQLAFEATQAGGYGVVLDAVRVYPQSLCMDATITGISSEATAALISWAPRAGRQFELVVSPSAIYNLSEIDDETVIFHDSTITGVGKVIYGLTPETQYYVYVRTDCDDNESGHTNWVDATFTTPLGIPYTPSLASVPSSWSQKQGAVAASVERSSLTDNTSSYNWKATTNTTVFGTAHIYGQSNGTPSWLLTQALSIAPEEENASVLLSFKLALTNSATATTASTTAATSKFHVYVSADEGESWVLLRTIEGKEFKNTGAQYNILLDDFIESGSIRLAFVADAQATTSYFHMTEVRVVESDGLCLGIYGLKPTVTSNSISLAWNTVGTTGSVVTLSDVADFSNVLQQQTVSGSSHVFNGLETSATYYVKVRQDCEEGDSLTAQLKTPCPSTTITAENPFVEGFESYEGKIFSATDGVSPDCWQVYADDAVLPHVIDSVGTKIQNRKWYRHSGMKSLTFYGKGNCYAVLPGFTNELKTLRVSFWMQSDANSGTLTLGYITDGDLELNTFQAIATYNGNSGAMVQRTADLLEVPAEAKNLVIRWYASGVSTCCIDDIELSLLPQCMKVKGVQVTPGAAYSELTFTDNGAPAYDVLVTTKRLNPDTLQTTNVIAYRDTVTNDTVQIPGLAATTTYYAYVHPICEEQAEAVAWSDYVSFTTPCSVVSITKEAFSQNFNSITSGIPVCWDNTEGTSSASYRWSYYSSGHDGACVRFDSYINASGNTNLLATPSIDLSRDATLSFWWKNPYGGAGDVLISTDGGVTKTSLADGLALTSVSNWTYYEISLVPYTGSTAIIYFSGTSNYGTGDAYLYLDDVMVELMPTCHKMGALSLMASTANSATLRYDPTNAPQYQVVVSTTSINPATADLSMENIVYNAVVTTSQPVITGLEGNSRYYAYVRGVCEDEDYGLWSSEFTFKTLCTAIPVENFGTETFTDPYSVDCWTFGFTTQGTQTTGAYAKRNTETSYGAYIKLSKEQVAYTKNALGVDTAYSDGAYAISPQLGLEDIREYQVTFDAATISQASDNYKRLNVGVTVDPNDRSAIQILKTIDLDYAADSMAIKSYSVSFAAAEEDYLGREIRYVIFQLKESSKHDSTNFVLIDNVSIEPVASCAQVVESRVDSIQVYGAGISWEAIASSEEYQVMLSTVNSRRPDTIATPILLDIVDTNHMIFSDLESNTQYFAYVRAICGEGDTAKWSNAVRFRTAIAIPWDEPFEAASLSNGWQSLYNKFTGDSINTSSLGRPAGNYKWSIITTGVPSDMTAPAAYGYLDDYEYGYIWLISPTVDLTGHEGEYVEMSFDAERSSSTASDAKFYVIVSEDGGLSWKKSNATTWGENGDYEFNAIPTTKTSYSIGLTKYISKKIAIAFYMESPYGYSHIQHGLFVDNISVHTYDAICRGVQKVSVAPTASTATVKWEIEGTPAKADLEISNVATFATRLDSVSVEDAYEYTFENLEPNTTYYVRIKQSDCEDAEWKTLSFTTECLPLTQLPWSEDFESYESGDFSSDCWLNKHLEGNGSQLFQVYTSTNGDNSTHQLQLPDMRSGTKTLLGLPRFTLDEAAYQFVIDVYRNTSSYPKEGLRIFASLAADLDSTAVELAFISRNYNTADTTGVNIIPAEGASGWYTYKLDIPLEGDVRIFVQGESAFGSSTYMDNFGIRHAPVCPDVFGLAISDIHADSALVTIKDLDASGYHFVLATNAIDLNDLSVEDAAYILVNDSVYGDTVLQLAGLQVATTYYVYARTLCEDEKVGAWSAPKTFTSACGLISVIADQPWREGFENLPTGSSSSAAPMCWDLLNANQGSGSASIYVNTSSSYVHSGSKSLWFSINSSADDAFAILPEIDALNTLQIEFYYKHESTGSSGELFLGYMTDITDATSFVQIAGFTRSTSWEKAEAVLSAIPDSVIGTARLAFKYAKNSSSSSYYMGIDDIKVGIIPACLPVSDLAAKLTLGDGTVASLTWASDSVAGWRVQYATAANFANAIDATVTDTTFIALSGLTPETEYYARVKAICEDGAESEWCDAISFLPTNALSLTINDGTSTSEYVPVYGYWTDHLTVSQFVIPAADLAALQGTYLNQLTFYATEDNVSWGNAQFEVYMAGVPSTSIAALADWSVLSLVKAAGSLSIVNNQMVVLLDEPYQYDGGNLLIGFRQTTTGTYSYSHWYGQTVTDASYAGYDQSVSQRNFLPKMRIEYITSEGPLCSRPASLKVDAITSTSARLSYDKKEAPECEILMTSKALNPDTLTVDTFVVFRDTVSNDTIEFNGLLPQTPYYIYARALCEDGQASIWAATSFNTACEAVDVLPYVMDFEDETVSSIPSCWTVARSSGSASDYPYVYSSGTYAHGGTKSFAWGTSYTYSEPATTWASLPPMEEDIKNLEMSFWYRSASSSYDCDSIVVGVMSDPLDTTTFVPVDGFYPTSTTYVQAEVDFSSYAGNGKYITFKRVVIGEDSYYSSYYTPFIIDDIAVSKLPDCRLVKRLAASPVNATSATVHFVLTPSPEYDFVVTTEAIDPDTVAKVPDSLIIRYEKISNDTIELTGLTPATGYYVYVRSICEESEADWASTQFTTRCLAEIPYVQNFDDPSDVKPIYTGATVSTIPSCWEEGYESTSYLTYIQSNTNTSTYAFSGTSALYLYSTATYGSYIVLPEMDAALDTLQLTFKARAMYQGSSSVTNYATSTYAHSVAVGTMTDPNDFSTFEFLETYVLQEVATTPSSAADAWEDVTIYLQAATGKYITLVTAFSKSNNVWIDDVEVSRAPNCIAPAAIKVSAATTTADVTWISKASAFEVAVGEAGFTLPNEADSIYSVADTTGLHIEGLAQSTSYDLYIRSVCDESESSDWSRVTTFTTGAKVPFVDDFEDRNQWNFINGTYTNAWAWGSAVSNGGSSAMYISDDGGTTNEYSSSLAAVYATKTFDFEEEGGYVFQYDWRAYGESTYDYLRVALAPADTKLTAGSYAVSGLSSSSLPTGWQALDGGSKLNLSSTWQTIQSDEISLKAGQYMVVFAWINDGSTLTNPPAAIDNFSIDKVQCSAPLISEITDVTDSSAVVRWDTLAPAYEIALIRGLDTVYRSVTGCDTLLLENLNSSTSYVIRMRAICDEETTSNWSAPYGFATTCAVLVVDETGWSENFDALTEGIPGCWDNSEGTTTTESYKWSYASSGHDGACVQFNSYSNSSGNTNYLATPELLLTKDMQLTFWWKNGAGGAGEVLISTDGGTTKTSLLNNLTEVTEWTEYELDLSDYTGSTVIIYFKGTSNWGYGDAYLNLDDVSIAPLPNCRAVKNLELSDITAEGVTLNFSFADGQLHDAQVAISRESAFDPQTAMVLDTISDSTYTFQVALQDKVTYYVYVRQDCGEEEVSAWKSISFVTPYVLRYDAEFTSTTLPDEWSRYSGKLNDVLAGTAALNTATSGWSLVSANTAIDDYHFKGNIYGTSFAYWVVSPLVSLAAPEDKAVMLHFDAAYNKYNNVDTDPAVGEDDRFVVLVSTDNGASWQIVKEWNNDGTGDYVLSEVPKEGKTYHVVLNDFIGQTVRVAFYGESTVSNADNDFHFGHISMNYSIEETYQSVICDGNDYVGADEGNTFYITPEEYHVGDNVYNKYIPAVNNRADSLITLYLTVMGTETFEDSVVLCEGEHFSQVIHGGTFDFDAYVGMQDQARFVTSEYGCRDVVKLKVTVIPSIEAHVYDSVARGETYMWHGKGYISATTATFDTISLVTGCDSTAVLHLSVYDAPEEAIHSVYAQSLLIAPNPVKAGEPIRVLTDFAAEELAEAHIEIVSSTGAIVYVQQGADVPCTLPGIPVSGMYIVRITVRDKIYISSLLVH